MGATNVTKTNEDPHDPWTELAEEAINLFTAAHPDLDCRLLVMISEPTANGRAGLGACGFDGPVRMLADLSDFADSIGQAYGLGRFSIRKSG